MAHQDLDTLDAQVLAIVRGENRDMSPAQVVTAVVQNLGLVSDVDVKRALWRLISQNELELSPEQVVRALPTPERAEER